eukprot:757408-Hanusia_phi.AAC.1
MWLSEQALLQLQSEDLKELKFSLGHRKHLLEELDKLRRLEQEEDPNRPAFSGIVLEKDAAKGDGHGAGEQDDKPTTRDEHAILTEKFTSQGPPRLGDLSFRRQVGKQSEPSRLIAVQAQHCAASVGNVKPMVKKGTPRIER